MVRLIRGIVEPEACRCATANKCAADVKHLMGSMAGGGGGALPA